MPRKTQTKRAKGRLRIGLVYDLRADYLAMGYGPEEVGEFDSISTINELDKALTALNGFRADVEYRLRKDGGDLSPIADWGSKLPGMAVRIAAIIHAFSLPDDPFGMPIGPDAMEAAVRIGEYLIDHAKAAFQCMGGDPEMELARRIAAWLSESSTRMISRRDLLPVSVGHWNRGRDGATPGDTGWAWVSPTRNGNRERSGASV